ncbi:hypothetical protein Tco_0489632 [Tanacetum coccineum]
MAFGKDKSNPLIVDSLLKTIRLSIHLVVYNEELAIPEQTATGKGISNPLMAACKRCQICIIFSVVSWIISGPVTNPLTTGGCLGGELLKRRVVTKQRFAYQRFEQVASCSRSELLYTKQRVAYQRFAYQRFEQFNKGPVRARVLNDLSAEEKERYKADIRATNILLQGIPKDIYSLINHYTDAKDIWENVKMILEGSELTKDDRESQLYDEFEHFCQNKGETIQGYYVRFMKLINDMRNIKMTSRMQLNSKFVNNMLWCGRRFITEVNLTEVHSTYNYPLALVSEPQLSVSKTNHPSLLKPQKNHLLLNFQLDSGTSSNARNKAMVQDGKVMVQDVRGRYNATNQGRPFQRNNARGNGVAGNVGDSDYFKDKMLLMQAQENGAVLDEEQLLFLAGEQVTNVDDDVDDSP